MSALGVIGVILATGLLGHLFYRAFAPAKEASSWGEALFVQVLLGVLLVGWPALALAELGLFSLPRLALLVGVAAAAVLAWRRRWVRRWRWPALRFGWSGMATLLVLLGAALVLVWPGERLLGGNDPGVYASTGAAIARTGSIRLYDDQVAALSAREEPFPLYWELGQRWLFPGFYVNDVASGEITPQFLHLYPTWLALFCAAGGLPALLLSVPLFPLLGVAAFYFLLRRVVGRWAAAAAALLALNPAVVWFAREPVAEGLAMALVLGGWYLLDRALREPGRRDLAVWAGLALGQLALAKLELLTLPFLLGLYLALRAAGRPLQGRERAFLAAYLLPLAHGIAHMATVSQPYMHTFLTSAAALGVAFLTLPRLVLLGGIAAAAVVALVLLRRHLLRPLRWLRAHEREVRLAGAVLWLLLAFYAAAVRPQLAANVIIHADGHMAPYNERLTFLRLGWYLSPLGLALGVLGLAGWIRRRLAGPALPFLGAFALELGLYIHRTMDFAWHFWMMRRYLPLILPVLTLGIAAVLQGLRWAPLGRVARRGGAIVLLGLLILFAVQADAPFAARREMAGLAASLEGIAAQVPDGRPLLVAVPGMGAALATPLRFVNGAAAYALPDAAPPEMLWQLLADWPADGGPAYLLTNRLPAVLWSGFAVEESGFASLDVVGTEQTLNRLPGRPLRLALAMQLLRVERLPAAPATVRFTLATPLWTGSCLAVDLPKEAVSLTLRLEAAGFRPEPLPPARLQVFWEGVPIAARTLERSWEFRRVEMPLAHAPGPLLGAGMGRLSLCVETWNPRQAGYADDPRDLGILLRSLEIVGDYPGAALTPR